MKAPKTAWELITATFNEWMEDKAQRLGAALAYYAAFSLAPLLVIAVWVAGQIFRNSPPDRIYAQISAVMGANAADAILASMEALQHASGGGWATVLSIIALILGATAVFGSLQDAMNTVWEVTPKPRNFVVDMLRTRLISFLMVLCFCFLLIASVIASAVLAIATKHFETQFPGLTMLWKIADQCVSFVLTAVVFATLYKVLPDVRLHWRDVSIGAAATAVLFTLGRIPLGMYLKHSGLSSVYGAAGSIMVLLAWVYYSAQILFLGAEFTQVYANRYGWRIQPARGAVFVGEAKRVHEGIPHANSVNEAREQQRRSA
jgi:membrane protein